MFECVQAGGNKWNRVKHEGWFDLKTFCISGTLIQVSSFLIAKGILNTVWTTVCMLENNKACWPPKPSLLIMLVLCTRAKNTEMCLALMKDRDLEMVTLDSAGPFCFVLKQMICTKSADIFPFGQLVFTLHHCKVAQSRTFLMHLCHCLMHAGQALHCGIVSW